MRLLTAILALGLTSLAPAGALARPDRSGCALEVSASSTHVGAGETVKLNGLLACPTPAAAAEQTVTIFQHTAGTHGAAAAGTVTTGPTGDFHYTSEELSSNTVFSARFLRARSRRATIKVTPSITLTGPSEPRIQLTRRHSGLRAAVVFTGTVSPSESGARVVLQRESASAPGDWRRIGLTSVAADGSYSISHVFSASGLVTVRTVVRRHGQMAAASEPLTYEVAQRQNPNLTIEAAPNPLAYGQSVTIHGTVAGGAQASVTLLARTHGAAFTTVEEVQTDAEGNYEFAPQMPLASTWYSVRSGHLRSALLLEGVKPLLTAQVSSASVHAGETVTFSGSLTPASSGQVVLLERRLPSGVAYHVVGTFTIGEGSSQFSFERQLTGSTGKQVYRIKAPRNGGLMASASEPLEVEVTPAATPEEEGAGEGEHEGEGPPEEEAPGGEG